MPSDLFFETFENTAGQLLTTSNTKFTTVVSANSSFMGESGGQPCHGSFNCRVQTSTTSMTPYAVKDLGAVYTTLGGRICIRYQSGGNPNSLTIFALRNTGTIVMRVGFTATSMYPFIIDSTGANVAQFPTGYGLSINRWNRLEWHYNAGNPATCYMNLYFGQENTNPIQTISGSGNFGTGANEYYLGLTSNIANSTAYWVDDVLVNDYGMPGPHWSPSWGPRI